MHRLGLILIAFLLVPGAHAQPAFQVKDINPTRPRGLNNQFQQDFAAIGSTLFFVHDDGGTGQELWKLDAATGAASIVKDICPGSCASSPGLLTAWNGALFFQANDSAHGWELWRSDGTAGGTFMVRDVNSGPESIPPGWLTVLDGVMYFLGSDALHGQEIWTTDGTAAGTRLFIDVRPGPSSSSARILAASGGKFLLAAFDEAHGSEPWITDGTEAGTGLLKDLIPGPFSAFFSISTDKATVLPDGSFLFGAHSPGGGIELWRSDGTETGTALVKDINPVESSNPSDFVHFNGKLYFRATTQDQGRQLWVTDGTEAGTVQFHDGGNSSTVDLVTVLDGQLYFRASNGLWKSDGTQAGTVRVSSSSPSSIGTLGGSIVFVSGSFSQIFLYTTDGTEDGTVLLKAFSQQSSCYTFLGPSQVLDGSFYFFTCPGRTVQELWQTDGTVAGTVQVPIPMRTPAFPAGSAAPDFFRYSVGSHLLFIADDGFGAQLWHTDSTLDGTQPIPGFVTGTWPLSSNFSALPLGDGLIHSTASELFNIRGNGSVETLSSSPMSTLTRVGDVVFLQHSDPASPELWKTDGTTAGTGAVKDVIPGTAAANIAPLRPWGSLFLFTAGALSTGKELWRSDGTEAGTIALKTLDADHDVSGSAIVGGNYLFGIPGALWKTDGTRAGTALIKSFDPTGTPQNFVAIGSRLVFALQEEAHGLEPWVSDGTEAGTHLLKDIQPGPSSSAIDFLIVVQNKLLFLADDGAHGKELWVTDGTAAGTRLLKDIYPGSASPFYPWYFIPRVIVQDRLFFVADDGTHGDELWVTDGTEAGTRLVKDIAQGPRPALSDVSIKAAAGDQLFFVANDEIHGQELWISDGTEAGTRIVKEISPGAASTLILDLAFIDNVLVFSASDGIHGAELWRSDGTAAGTWRIQDIAPGPGSSSPSRFTANGSHVYFITDNGTSGTDLWALPRKALNPTFTDVPPAYWAWKFIEALASAGVTTGCAPGLYCPVSQVSRAEMAVFLERGLRGGGFAPPAATGTRFTDVPASYWAAAWIEQLAADGITSGCAPNQYCPDALISRAEMAVFLLRAKHGAAYTPPPATGVMFSDVPASFWAAAWIEQLAVEKITTGCAPGQYCPGSSVSRDQMAAFLVRTFGLL